MFGEDVRARFCPLISTAIHYRHRIDTFSQAQLEFAILSGLVTFAGSDKRNGSRNIYQGRSMTFIRVQKLTDKKEDAEEDDDISDSSVDLRK